MYSVLDDIVKMYTINHTINNLYYYNYYNHIIIARVSKSTVNLTWHVITI